MTTPVETVSPTATLREAAATMRDHDINSLVVPSGELGIVTSTDVLDAVAQGHDLTSYRVTEAMTAPVEWVTPDLQLQEAAAMMTTLGVNHLPVRDSDGDYVGMLSATDLREVLAESATHG